MNSPVFIGSQNDRSRKPAAYCISKLNPIPGVVNGYQQDIHVTVTSSKYLSYNKPQRGNKSFTFSMAILILF